MVVPSDYSYAYILQKSFFGGEGKIIGSLSSYLGILGDEFEELLAEGYISKVQTSYNKLGLRVKTYRYHSITWIYFYEAFAPLKLSHLPRHPIVGENTRPAWVYRQTCVWVDISSGEKIRLDARYQSSELLVKRMLEFSADEEVMKKMEDCDKISWANL